MDYRRFAFQLVLVLIALEASLGRARSQPPIDDFAWAQDIVLRADFALKASETGTRRWKTAPKLVVVDGTKEQQKAVAEVVEHLNETLKQTPLKGIELLKAGDRTATLPLFFVRRSDLPAKAGAQGAPADVVQHLTKQKTVFWSFARWDDASKWELKSGFVLVASDAAYAGKVKHHILAALCYELGLMNYSGRRSDSIFYRDKAKRNDVERLSAKDQQLIEWFYNHVPAGTTDGLKKLYDDHWAMGK
jgi:Protein of unknown function (DUF2927)